MTTRRLRSMFNGSFAPGLEGFIGVLHGRHQAGWTGRLLVAMPGGEEAYLDFITGELRAATCRGFTGMTVLSTCALFATGQWRTQEASGAISDQFAIITAVLIDHLREAVSRIQSGKPQTDMAIDAATGTPIPRAGTDPTQLAALGQIRIRVREPAPAASDEDDFANLIPADLREGSYAQPPTDQTSYWLPPPIGQMLGKCYLSAEVGSGATAIVFKALQLSLRIDVAVKVFRPDAPAGHLSVDEARLLARLNHPNIVRVLDCSDEHPWPHLVAEFVDGTTLAAIISQSGGMSQASAVALMRQAAAGLAYAEAQGVVHGDVKPGNILVARDQTVKLTDLGVARTSASAATTQVVGTPAYIAPEQVADGAPPSAASDVYAFGATFFHALSGRPPFVDEDPLQLMVRHVEDAVPSVRALAAKTDVRLDRLISRMLAKRPADRPGWDEILRDLDRMAQTQGSIPGLSKLAMTTMAAALDQLRWLLGQRRE